jgi:hypothetical protein
MAGAGNDRDADAWVDGLQQGRELVGLEQLVVGADHDPGRGGNARQHRPPVGPELQARHQAEGVDRGAIVVGLGVGREGDGRQAPGTREVRRNRAA